MNANIEKRYRLSREERETLEYAKMILRDISHEGFADEFCQFMGFDLEELANDIDSVLDMDGKNWIGRNQ